MNGSVLSLRDLKVTYANGVHALRGIDLEIGRGEALALVGESGCGKSTLATAILGLLPAGTLVGGEILLQGQPVVGVEGSRLRSLRGRLAGLVIQDPMGSFNPVMRVGAHVIEARRLHDRTSSERALWPWAARLLDSLRIPEPERRARHYPHEWSGGMLQRAAIAAATANHPPLLIADEPTASLDGDLAVEVMEGLRERQLREGTAMLLVTHQLGLAAHVAERIAVMYAGRLVEVGASRQVVRSPRHPYSRALLAALPRPGRGLPEPLEGEVPSLVSPPLGCAFAGRCPIAEGGCGQGEPPELMDGLACPVVRRQLVGDRPGCARSRDWDVSGKRGRLHG